jgi:hypothetical protein
MRPIPKPPRDFYVRDMVRYRGHTRPAPIIRPVRYAYKVNGEWWLIVEWENQTEWLPTPAKRWFHEDGTPLGDFIGLRSAPDFLNEAFRGEGDE